LNNCGSLKKVTLSVKKKMPFVDEKVLILQLVKCFFKERVYRFIAKARAEGEEQSISK